MTPKELLDAFEILAEAPDGVKRLRELVLSLAVRGKLVAQDQTDAPASDLVKRMREEKARLVAEGKARKESECIAMTREDAPFEIPAGWEWRRASEVVAVITDGDHQPPPRADSGVPFLVIGNVSSGVLSFDGARCVRRDYYDALDWAHKPTTGDLLYTVTGSFGIAVVVGTDRPFCVQRHIAILKIGCAALPAYARIVLSAPHARAWSEEVATGTAQRTVSLSALRAMPVPLAPLAEQSRIVARVDALMSLLDQLEAARTTRESSRAAARDSALAALREAATTGEVEAAWLRVRDRFDELVMEPTGVVSLRHAILQLAVRGRLVAQDPSEQVVAPPKSPIDARATVARRGRSLRRGAARLDPITPFEIPKSWRWYRFDEVATIASNLVDPIDWPDAPHVAPDSIEKGTGRLLGYRTIREDGVRSAKHHFHAGQILYSKIRPNLNKVAVVDFDGLCSADMYPIDPRMERSYLHLFMLSPDFVAAVTLDDNRLAMPKVNQEQLSAVQTPVPPRNEQRRIVARVGALMALCDRLEARLRAETATQAAFAAAAVHHLDA